MSRIPYFANPMRVFSPTPGSASIGIGSRNVCVAASGTRSWPCGFARAEADAVDHWHATGPFSLEGEEATGAKIVKFALSAPLKQIALNAGLEPGVVVEKVRNLTPGEGLNAATGEYVNLLAAGIADPVKVTRSALQNAGSIAGLFLTTEAVVADKPEPPAAPADGGAGDMGGMY